MNVLYSILWGFAGLIAVLAIIDWIQDELYYRRRKHGRAAKNQSPK